jgi:uncharacterized protein
MVVDPSYLVQTEAELRQLFGTPSERAQRKQIDRLDDAARSFLAHCTFVAMGTTNADGTGDVSPKGGPAGFVHVLDDHHVAFGELPGNNRLDGFRNLVSDPRTGLLCVVPGSRETLRLNGSAMLSRDPALLATTAIDGKLPKIAVVVRVSEVFVHCGKAVIRSGLWQPDQWPDRSDMVSTACMLATHAKIHDDPTGEQTGATLEVVYERTLWNP